MGFDEWCGSAERWDPYDVRGAGSYY
jgi:hypothetical protein